MASDILSYDDLMSALLILVLVPVRVCDGTAGADSSHAPFRALSF